MFGQPEILDSERSENDGRAENLGVGRCVGPRAAFPAVLGHRADDIDDAQRDVTRFGVFERDLDRVRIRCAKRGDVLQKV